MLRVLHLITRMELGGAQRNTLYTVANLDRRNFVPALAWGPGAILDAQAHRLDDVEIFEIPVLRRDVSPANDLRALQAVRRVIRSFEPDIVHTHSSKAGVIGRAAARWEGVETIIHSVHGWGFAPTQAPLHRMLFFLAERIAFRWCDHWVFVSDLNRREGARLGLSRIEDSSLIRSGIRLKDFSEGGDGPALKKELGIPAGALVLTQVGNFKPQKAPLDFVELAAILLRERHELYFVMVGDGPLRNRVEKRIESLGLEKHFRLPGWSSEIPSLMKATDVAVLCSFHEGLPRAVVEALASGTPVVATAVDGTPEIVRPGINGFLFRPGDLETAARLILKILSDRELRQRMVRAAGENLEDFDIDRMVTRQEELYRCLNSREKSLHHGFSSSARLLVPSSTSSSTACP